MRLIFFVIYISTFWGQAKAPEAKPCGILDSVRLYDSPMYPQLCNEVEGRLEWAYFCDKFANSESLVFCRVLGYSNFTDNGGKSSSTFSGLTHINNLNCFGEETLLTNCSFSESTQSCRVAKGLRCTRCNTSADCLGGVCLINGTCDCLGTCLNGGYCFVGKCICLGGFSGVNCGQCSPPCQNAGTCSNNGTCECPEMFYGSRCELSYNGTTNSDISQRTNDITNSTSNPTDQLISSTLILVIIATVVPTIICSCTAIIICLATLLFCGCMMSRMKLFQVEKKEKRNSPIQQMHNKRSDEYELNDLNMPNHEYYYIDNTHLVNKPPAPIAPNRQDDGNYVVMDSEAMTNYGENSTDVKTNPTSNTVEIEKESRYVVNDLDDIL